MPGGQNLEPYASYPRKMADVPVFCNNITSVDFVFECLVDTALTQFLPGSAPNSIIAPKRGEALRDPCSEAKREFEVLVPINLSTFSGPTTSLLKKLAAIDKFAKDQTAAKPKKGQAPPVIGVTRRPPPLPIASACSSTWRHVTLALASHASAGL